MPIAAFAHKGPRQSRICVVDASGARQRLRIIPIIVRGRNILSAVVAVRMTRDPKSRPIRTHLMPRIIEARHAKYVMAGLDPAICSRTRWPGQARP
jgi:hypothetical protein